MFGPFSEYHLLPSSLAALLVLVIVAAGVYLAFVPRRIRGREWSAVLTLIAANTAVFVVQWGGGMFSARVVASVVSEAGLVPGAFVAGYQWWAPVTKMFLHGGFFHFAMNMLVLWFIGRILELRMGRRPFVFLYLAAGLFAALVTVAGAFLLPEAVRSIVPSLPRPEVPNVGASGAIFGLLGYLVMGYPKERLMLIFPVPMVLPAWVLAVVFVVLNVVLAFIPDSPVAWWAHLAGMLVGVVWARMDRRRGRHRVRIDGVTGWGSGGPVHYTYTYWKGR